MTFHFQNNSDPRSECNAENTSAKFSGCIRTHNKSRLLGLLQSGKNPNKVVSDLDISIVFKGNEEKREKLQPYLQDGLLLSTSVLHEAILFNDEDVINILLNFGCRINDFCGINRRGLSCLMLAVILGHNNLLELLVKRGCNYSMFNGDQQTALDLAIITSNVTAVKFLAPFKRFFYFQNPKRSKLTVCDYLTQYARRETYLEIVDQMVTIGYSFGSIPGKPSLLYLLKNFAGETELAHRVIRSIVENHMITSETNLLNEPIDKSGRRILHVLSQNGQAEAVNIVIEAGADVNISDSDGDIPLHIALREPVTSQSIQVISLLLEAGADLFKRNNSKLSPLDLAIEYSQIHSNIAKFVSSRASEISWSTKIHDFLSDPDAKLNLKMLQFLRSRKVTFQSLNSSKQSPLHILLNHHGSTTPCDILIQCINVMLDSDSVLDIIDNDQMSPAMTALSKDVPPSIVARLISGPLCTQHINSKGQDILSMIISEYNAKDEDKLSLCQVAVRKGALANNPSRFGCKSLIAACKEAGLSAQGIPKFLLCNGFKPLREDIECISQWSLSLLEFTLERCHPTTIRTQFPNILITSLKTFVPRLSDPKSPGVSSLLSVFRKLIQDVHVDVNYSERGKRHILHLLIQLKVTHRYPVCPLIKEVLSGQNVDLNTGHDRETGTPLTHALRVGEYSIADLLIRSMTDFSKTNIRTMALRFGFSGIIKTLHKKGAKIDNRFFEKGFGQQDMGIIEEMQWLKHYLENESYQEFSCTKKFKSI